MQITSLMFKPLNFLLILLYVRENFVCFQFTVVLGCLVKSSPEVGPGNWDESRNASKLSSHLISGIQQVTGNFLIKCSTLNKLLKT